MNIDKLLEKLWYSEHTLITRILYPFGLIYPCISYLRRIYLQRFRQSTFSVPVIVVGNLTVGGVGKTPLVIELAKQCQLQGLRVGIVSRGYVARINHFPHEVQVDSQPSLVGDEPLLLARKTGCPVVIAPKRADAVRYLLQHHQSQIILSDDGLQHYAMGRSLEILVIDGMRGLGNGLCLPVGPLRERAARLKKVDFIIVNGGDWPGAYRMDLIPGNFTQLLSGQSIKSAELSSSVAAVAAIGNPKRFFATLTQLGVTFNPYPFRDHYQFQAHHFCFEEDMIVMTEKDAVKCQALATNKMYFLPVEAKLGGKFWEALWSHKQLQGYMK